MSSQQIISENQTKFSSQQNREINESQRCSILISKQQFLKNLKQQILLTKSQLIDLINKNKFIEKINQLNQLAKNYIKDNQIEVALIYLTQAEYILEYAASYGKNISKNFIVQLLHNTATCYQIIWDLQNCSNYVQALIFNYNSDTIFQNISSKCLQPVHSLLKNINSNKNLLCSQRNRLLRMQKRTQLIKYHLLQCAISSQLKNHKKALLQVKKATQINVKIFEQLKMNKRDDLSFDCSQIPPIMLAMLKQISIFSQPLQTNRLQSLRLLSRFHISVYRSRCLFHNLSVSKQSCSTDKSINRQKEKDIFQKFRKFTIADIMQLKIKNLQQNTHNQDQISYQRLVQILILYSVCNFVISTQLRYLSISNEKQSISKEKQSISKEKYISKEKQISKDKQISKEKYIYKQSIEYKQSQIFHLLAILMVTMYLPFDIAYLEFLISSYQKYYKINILINQQQHQLTPEQAKLIKDELFPQNKPSLTQSQQLKLKQHNSQLEGSFQQQLIYDESNCQNPQNTKHIQSSFVHDNIPQNQQDNIFDSYYYVNKNYTQDLSIRTAQNLLQINPTIKNKIKTKKQKSKSKISKSKSKISRSKSKGLIKKIGQIKFKNQTQSQLRSTIQPLESKINSINQSTIKSLHSSKSKRKNEQKFDKKSIGKQNILMNNQMKKIQSQAKLKTKIRKENQKTNESQIKNDYFTFKRKNNLKQKLNQQNDIRSKQFHNQQRYNQQRQFNNNNLIVTEKAKIIQKKQSKQREFQAQRLNKNCSKSKNKKLSICKIKKCSQFKQNSNHVSFQNYHNS